MISIDSKINVRSARSHLDTFESFKRSEELNLLAEYAYCPYGNYDTQHRHSDVSFGLPAMAGCYILASSNS